MKRIFLFLGCFLVVIILGSMGISYFVHNDISKDEALFKNKLGLQGDNPQQANPTDPSLKNFSKEVPHRLTPEELTQYGVFVQENEAMPTNQKEWEFHMEQILVNKGVFDSQDAKKALTLLKSTQKDYETLANRLDDEIKALQEKKKENPLNDEIDQNLQRLYQLSAVNKILKEQTKPVATKDQ